MALALYRKYRSKSLAEVVGQDHITTILARAIKAGRISHAYLLTGPRGVGKTSVARILAHEINGLPYDEDSTHLDIIEIDAASNNGVEDVRDLREKVQIAPVSASKKVYIIDEVHMLSKAAFNALLKTLEEPPEHVVFILATTDVDKLPATIISRTQRFGFRAIAPADAVSHMRYIADEEKIKISDEALQLLAERGDGSFRDSISLLDQLSSLSDEITAELIETTLGLAPRALLTTIFEAIEHHDITSLTGALDAAQQQGIAATVLADQLTHQLRTLAIEKPQLLMLLDTLLDVAKSSQPDLKLFTVLGNAAAKQAPKTVALATPVLEVTATIEELTKQPIKMETKTKPKVEITEEKAPKKPTVKRSAFDWETLVEYTRKNHVAVYSVLSKCAHDLDGSDLTLYTQNAFYKKKLDDAKYSTVLYESLEAIGSSALTVHTVPTAPPPKDSQAAAVAAIMGGGEEIVIS
jgi:DNA polymerase III subunit gamma/tau